MTGETDLSFYEWLAELNRVAKRIHGHADLVADTGRECWRDFYEEGFSPSDAYAEDCSNG